MLKKSLIAKTDPKANDKQNAVIGDVRITYITSRLIRVESFGSFTDLASKTVWNRNFPCDGFKAEKKGKSITVETKDAVFIIENGVPYSVCFKDSGRIEIFSRQKNFKGTRRTLDMTYGKVPLDNGLITESGAFLLDDSHTMLIDEQGHFVKRQGKGRDYYAFAYGKNYRDTIRAFYMISGEVPLIPRFALGVWWSRYHAYTQDEYLNLMRRFKEEDVPITVATVDMDWHWVKDINEKFGVKYGGWTGYSWNTELFPDYKAFLKELKDDNLHITLNLHPADGVHSYEDMYKEMANAVGINPDSGKTVPFQCSNDDFWNAYFDILHKPYEKDGVDFWWIDWQQGKKSDVDGLDPLEALNHYHFLDNAENGDLPLILSRYAGLGSHRYPLGFSGDTAINWKVLDFQPYFTVNAANAAYTWWSHDIGGHHQGFRDDDLYMRWIEFGVFSPVFRLHSTAKEFLGKEPWKYRADICLFTKEWLRFRHRLIPYIYTMNYRTHKDGVALCEPMYYSYADKKEAYNVPNQYMFGSEIMVCPITTPQVKKLNMGKVKAWIPEGRWTDIATNQVYEGEQTVTLFRDINTIPILAKEGAIIPLADCDSNKTENPDSLTVLAYSGNSSFVMIEDNGKTDFDSHNAKTKFEIAYDSDSITFTVNAVEGDLSVIPEKRNYRILVRDITVDSKPLVIEFKNADIHEKHTATINNAKRVSKENAKDAVINIFSRWQQTTAKKDACYKRFEGADTQDKIENALRKSILPKCIKEAIKENLSQA